MFTAIVARRLSKRSSKRIIKYHHKKFFGTHFWRSAQAKNQIKTSKSAALAPQAGT
jgi:hypothetical protein